MRIMTMLFVLSALYLSTAFAGMKPPVDQSTDYTCMSDCSARGYLYSYCKSICSY